MANQTLALFLRALDNRYQHAQKSEFYARAHVHRFSIVELDARNDAEAQMQQLRECLRGPENARPRALFVNPVRESLLQGVAREAARLGVGWVSLNRTCDYVTDLRREYPRTPFLCVDPDQGQVGRLQARQLRLLLPGGGSVFYVHGPIGTSSARLRMTAFQTELAGSSIRVIPSGGDWSEESGFQAVTAWLLSHRSLHWGGWAVVAQNDSMAMGASQALSEMALAKNHPEALELPIFGCDGLASYGQRFVSERKLAATVVIPPTAGRAVEEVCAALQSGRLPTADVSLGVSSFPDLDVLAASTRTRNGAHAERSTRIPAPADPSSVVPGRVKRRS